METLTAIRSFAVPSYSPARRVRLDKRKWYLLRMQNVETDPRFDYVGLGEGEYTELLPGNKARERRDARLNHCNGIAEYDGPIWQVSYTLHYWQEARRDPKFFPSENEAKAEVERYKAKGSKWIEDVAKERDRMGAILGQIRAGTYKGIGDREMAEGSIRDCQRILDRAATDPHPHYAVVTLAR